MDLLVGLDIGTSSVKAGLFDSAGGRLASANRPVKLYIPEPGWAEQDPPAWWEAACQALQQVIQTAKGSRILAVGLSGQCPGHVLVTPTGQAIGRAIIWRDQRAQVEARWLAAQVSPSQALEFLGSDSAGDATSPLARLLWLKAHRREDWASARWVLQPKDYISLKLTDTAATDRYSAYCLAHPESGEYDSGLFDRLGIDLKKLPGTCMPDAVIGQVTQAASRETGLPAGTSVVAGTIDAYCDALAGGIACPGRVVDVAGTSEIVSLQIDRQVSAPGIFAAKIGDQVAFLCGPTQAGGETLRWLARNFYPEFTSAIDFSLMESEAGRAPAGCNGMVFLPYLNGERTPVWDADARGAFFGLTLAHQRAHFTRAVYEGCAFAVHHILELGEQARGVKAEKIVLCGGGSRSYFWNQVKADILQMEVYPAEIPETGCLGAAILASVGAGWYPDLTSASQAMVRLKDPIRPNRENQETYKENYRIYRQLYPALRPLTGRQAELSNGRIR